MPVLAKPLWQAGFCSRGRICLLAGVWAERRWKLWALKAWCVCFGSMRSRLQTPEHSHVRGIVSQNEVFVLMAAVTDQQASDGNSGSLYIMGERHFN